MDFGWGNTHDTLNVTNSLILKAWLMVICGVAWLLPNAFITPPAFTTASPAEDITRSSASD